MPKPKIISSDLEKAFSGVMVRGNVNLHLKQSTLSALYKIMYDQFSYVFDIAEENPPQIATDNVARLEKMADEDMR